MGIHDKAVWASIPRPERAALVAAVKLPDWLSALEHDRMEREHGR